MSKETESKQMISVKVIENFCKKHIEECEAYIVIRNNRGEDSKLYEGIRMGYIDILNLLKKNNKS